MDELGFTLAGFAVLGVLHYAVAIVFAVSEYRKWRPTGWIIPLAVGIKLCELFCNRVVPRDVSGELALCCCLSCGLLYLVLMLWVNVKLNALAEACPAKGAE